MLNRLGVDHESDRKTDGWTDKLKPYSAKRLILIKLRRRLTFRPAKRPTRL